MGDHTSKAVQSYTLSAGVSNDDRWMDIIRNVIVAPFNSDGSKPVLLVDEATHKRMLELGMIKKKSDVVP